MLTLPLLERRLWAAAEALRGAIDASDYRGLILGALFLKRLSDVFDEEARAGRAHDFTVPHAARWATLAGASARVGEAMVRACAEVERANPSLSAAHGPGGAAVHFAYKILCQLARGATAPLRARLPLGTALESLSAARHPGARSRCRRLRPRRAPCPRRGRQARRQPVGACLAGSAPRGAMGLGDRSSAIASQPTPSVGCVLNCTRRQSRC